MSFLREENQTLPAFGHLGCRCYILVNGKENLEIFDEGIFLGYFEKSKAY